LADFLQLEIKPARDFYSPHRSFSTPSKKEDFERQKRDFLDDDYIFVLKLKNNQAI